MKRYLLIIVLFLSSSIVFSATVTPLGFCGDSSYFEIYGMEYNSIYEVKAEGTNNALTTWVTPQNDTTIKFAVAIAPNTNIEIRFRYNAANTTWLGWYSGWKSSDNQYSSCSALLVGISNFKVRKSGSNVFIEFDAGDESVARHYNIWASTDGENWEIIKVLPPNSSAHYSLSVPLIATVAFLPFFILFCKKRKHFFILLVMMLIFLGCKKVVEESKEEYKFFQVEMITTQGDSIFSKIKRV
ncbi:MAG: hypothetical protein ABIN48_06845 [Ginsengibacter sp.]